MTRKLIHTTKPWYSRSFKNRELPRLKNTFDKINRVNKLHQQLKPFTIPVFDALNKIQYWIAQEKISHIMVAASTRKELTRHYWPDHVKISAAKSLGRKVVARGPRRNALAYWPDDGCLASLQPFLVCVIKGQAMLRIADYRLHCQEGDLVFIPRGVARGTRSNLPLESTGLCDLLWFYLDEMNEEFYSWIGHSEPGLHVSGPEHGTCWVQNRQLARPFLSLCEELQDNNDREVAYHLLVSVIFLLRREIERGRAFLPRHHHADKHETLTQSQHDPIEQACKYIDEHLEQSLTAGQIARYVCLSLTSFNERFRQRAGCTFHEYLTARRLERSTALLRETDTSIDTVSRLVGLHYSQLRRLYYQHHRCTPGEFRKAWVLQRPEYTAKKN